ncbi:NUDIX domain-containing protein [Agromyces lapidis]|uniref:NUDIX domain-containing protein n=1 Tax=Agromyces lapidis TaxID=279574 RepID=A0ABV5SVK4_9MICO|nr:NUDIX domain-containing protein [Agromyces lapidis]
MDSAPESPSSSAATRSAATVVLLRDGELGLEVLLAERPSDRGSFAGAWVFPGGAVDEADALGGPTDGLAAARRAAAREVEEEVGLVVDEKELVPFSLWTPPKGAPKQLTTAFFAVRVPDGELRLAADEVVAAEWIRPVDALDRHAAGAMTLWPPTWVTLHGLLGARSVDAALAAFAEGGVRPYRARRDDARRMVLWQEDGEYDAAPGGDGRIPAVSDDAPDAQGARHRLMMDRLPWVYHHTF